MRHEEKKHGSHHTGGCLRDYTQVRTDLIPKRCALFGIVTLASCAFLHSLRFFTEDCLEVLTPNTALEHVLKSLLGGQQNGVVVPWMIELLDDICTIITMLQCFRGVLLPVIVGKQLSSF